MHPQVQHRVPKLDAVDLSPARWPAEPPLEWSAAGDGALFATLHDTGMLDSLLEQDFRYMFVSDADNPAVPPPRGRPPRWAIAPAAPPSIPPPCIAALS